MRIKTWREDYVAVVRVFTPFTCASAELDKKGEILAVVLRVLCVECRRGSGSSEFLTTCCEFTVDRLFVRRCTFILSPPLLYYYDCYGLSTTSPTSTAFPPAIVTCRLVARYPSAEKMTWEHASARQLRARISKRRRGGDQKF